MIRKKHKKVCKTLNYIEQLLILASAITGLILISAFVSLVRNNIGIMSSAGGLKIRALTSRIEKYKLKIKEK